MSSSPHVLALVGSYRKGGTVDSAVAAILEAAERAGARTRCIYLTDQHIEFCMNCRSCMQQPGEQRGRCLLQDDMEGILQQVEQCDRLVIGAPTNFGDVNALTRQFLERCGGYAWWPWDSPAPRLRSKRRDKRVVLVTASGAPALLGRWAFHSIKTLKHMTRVLGGRVVGSLWVGGVNRDPVRLSPRVLARARALGRKLAA